MLPGETETVPTEQAAETTPVPETQETVPAKHPLEQGGVRFNEVYGQMKAHEREASLLREENERLRKSAPSPAAATSVYTQDQLQAYVDAGKITPAQMAGQLALQAKEQGKQELRQEFQQDQRRNSALTEVNQYIDKVPALTNTASPELARVTRAAWEIAAELDLDVKDPRVQRRALREAFGPLDRITTVAKAREFDRNNADTHAETGGGGGATPVKADDPLKQVSKEWLDYWRDRVSAKDLLDMAKIEASKVRRRTR